MSSSASARALSNSPSSEYRVPGPRPAAYTVMPSAPSAAAAPIRPASATVLDGILSALLPSGCPSGALDDTGNTH